MDSNLLQYILDIIALGATVASGVATGDAAKGAQISSALVTIAQKAIAAHQMQVGQPIDESLLHPFEPLP
jgi:mannose/fructose/N-acetylgalactosamine-specific phosphotransferase system component IIC